jgi:hypothetical protein
MAACLAAGRGQPQPSSLSELEVKRHACSRGSRYRHEAAAYDPLADKMVDQLGFAVDRAGFERFGSFLERPAPDADQVVIGLEATGNYTRR